MVVALHSTVHDSLVSLLPDTLFRSVDVHPVRETPHAWVDGAKLDWGTGVIRNNLFERRIEIAIVQEDVWIMEPSIEVSLYRLDRLYDTIQLFIPCKYNEYGIRAWLIDLSHGVKAS